jgi:hypothetical protein
MFRTFIKGIILVVIAGAGKLASAAEDAPADQSRDVGQANASCDRKCLGKKTGESQAKLHRIGWEAAIRELGITGNEKTQILELANRIESRLKEAYASLSDVEIGKANEEADASLRGLVGNRFYEFKDAEHRGRFAHIQKERGVAPILSPKKK